MKKKSVTLSKEQRGYLEKVIKTGEEKARTIQRAHILLKADSGPDGPGWSCRQIHEAFGGNLDRLADTPSLSRWWFGTCPQVQPATATPRQAQGGWRAGSLADGAGVWSASSGA
jgi:hypothetical protein